MAILKLVRIKEGKGTGTAMTKPLSASIDYICNTEKTRGGIDIGGNCGNRPELIYETMLATKEFWNKLDGSQGFHYIISFPKDDRVTIDKVKLVAEEFCNELLCGQYEYVYAVHSDHEHLHAHIVFNSVSCIDGLKYHSPEGDWKKRLQPILDKICERYGLPVLEYDEGKDRVGKSYGEWKEQQKTESEKKKQGYSAFDVARDMIDEAIVKSADYEEFINYLKIHGYEVTRDGENYLSVRPAGRERAIRTGRLGTGYSKEEIIQRIQFVKSHPDIGKDYKIYGDVLSVNKQLRTNIRKYGEWHMSGMQKTYYQRWRFVAYIRNGKGRKLSPAAYDRAIRDLNEYTLQIWYLARHDIRDQEDVEERLEKILESKNSLAVEKKYVNGKIKKDETVRLVLRMKELSAYADRSAQEENEIKEIRERIEEKLPVAEAEEYTGKLLTEKQNLLEQAKQYRDEERMMKRILSELEKKKIMVGGNEFPIEEDSRMSEEQIRKQIKKITALCEELEEDQTRLGWQKRIYDAILDYRNEGGSHEFLKAKSLLDETEQEKFLSRYEILENNIDKERKQILRKIEKLPYDSGEDGSGKKETIRNLKLRVESLELQGRMPSQIGTIKERDLWLYKTKGKLRSDEKAKEERQDIMDAVIDYQKNGNAADEDSLLILKERDMMSEEAIENFLKAGRYIERNINREQRTIEKLEVMRFDEQGVVMNRFVSGKDAVEIVTLCGKYENDLESLKWQEKLKNAIEEMRAGNGNVEYLRKKALLEKDQQDAFLLRYETNKEKVLQEEKKIERKYKELEDCTTDRNPNGLKQLKAVRLMIDAAKLDGNIPETFITEQEREMWLVKLQAKILRDQEAMDIREEVLKAIDDVNCNGTAASEDNKKTLEKKHLLEKTSQENYKKSCMYLRRQIEKELVQEQRIEKMRINENNLSRKRETVATANTSKTVLSQQIRIN